jgi:hypothetical protein
MIGIATAHVEVGRGLEDVAAFARAEIVDIAVVYETCPNGDIE